MRNEAYSESYITARSRAKSFIKKYGVFYVIGIVIAFALKYYYSKADAEALDWILAPTARWVQVLSGITFEKQHDVGYVNHEYQFIIAPACAGMNFMVIAFSTLIFSFTHRIKTFKGRLLWICSCLITVYLYTILVNSLRIIPSMFLPQLDIYSGWITPERLHTIEGTVVYFASLLLLYFVVDEVLKRIAPVHDMMNRHTEESYIVESCAGVSSTGESDTAQSCAGKSNTEKSCTDKSHTVKGYKGKALIRMIYKYSVPVSMYFAITLGIPLINGALRNNMAGFLEHAALVIAVCFIVILLLGFLLIMKIMKKR